MSGKIAAAFVGANHSPAPSAKGAGEAEKMTATVAAAVVFGYAVSFVLKYLSWNWIVDARGRPVLEDFVTFWAAGHAALHGAALSVYDAHAQHAAEAATVGHGFDGALGWSYPPVFLLVAAGLASLPYAAAFIAWMSATFAASVGVAGMIARRKLGVLVAAAAPWVVTAVLPGQNGFFTAALFGIALLAVEERPLVAGLALGLLSYKPQFGILVPVALAAGGYWRAFAWAALGVVLWNGAAAAIFGFSTFGAFLHGLRGAAQSHLAVDGLGWNKLLSLYGMARAAGLSAGVAGAAQILAFAALAVAIATAWRLCSPYALKAALLAACVPLATPYVLVYDLPVLSVAVAFLYRHRGFDRVELALLAVAVPLAYPMPGCPLPVAFFVSVAVAAVAVRRLYQSAPWNRISPSWATDATSLPSSE